MLVYDEDKRIDWKDLFELELFQDNDEKEIAEIQGEVDLLKRSVAFNMYFSKKNEYIKNINDVKRVNKNFINNNNNNKYQ